MTSWRYYVGLAVGAFLGAFLGAYWTGVLFG